MRPVAGFETGGAPLHNVDGWTLVDFDSQGSPIGMNSFIYSHPQHGKIEVLRSKAWKRETPVEPRIRRIR